MHAYPDAGAPAEEKHESPTVTIVGHVHEASPLFPVPPVPPSGDVPSEGTHDAAELQVSPWSHVLFG